MSEISREKIEHLAKLSRLALSDAEIATYAEQIDGIVNAVSAVQNVDTAGIEPMSHPHSVNATMRSDDVVRTLNSEQALDQAPDVRDDRFVVPKIRG
ncbi:Asp-tRNA(Asn)/Glu-tRNA(Gln) amidotransferase subunit GatC [Corynebacterium pseudodiphtheriticum]|uniref:Asp-tRNA(Asn)/Glu-tRNA(Gln) amidotransferase subunit GatC n=1 Tax=Corynebacterium pseudodiphtheriticum TaxID=37637 RepID=UPI00254A9A17|nr:Asp-tRNA(Asn)/Glu-tRNA(Gln) amidotransferase subunit GatC [Corynebacterium pseudodiphtheriticum]MDK8500177.1 Asp-tRNA(Asn)/Glu-tRNA(Gln) amidotransferase subunit GatC [Corynebacterium pseudodiphtheriticum]MDK8577720.1 Asp-tRNA(Asn)/Glu-tRNA(Gln) amidotransferase subunit GatC [Corynebacterium pseudodiphtheriticum]MDK8700311.1 Asp-tRNA(Asn)/Glu-tRNA(Gln) amidotransferase subunit GatC [Corynebacterium pseudodiphtheriticum]MDK8761358.1 Asp-tRNA(Asn)/Glu-tRNA(Gln) amidotransferase subunit GatC [C